MNIPTWQTYSPTHTRWHKRCILRSVVVAAFTFNLAVPWWYWNVFVFEFINSSFKQSIKDIPREINNTATLDHIVLFQIREAKKASWLQSIFGTHICESLKRISKKIRSFTTKFRMINRTINTFFFFFFFIVSSSSWLSIISLSSSYHQKVCSTCKCQVKVMCWIKDLRKIRKATLKTSVSRNDNKILALNSLNLKLFCTGRCTEFMRL